MMRNSTSLMSSMMLNEGEKKISPDILFLAPIGCSITNAYMHLKQQQVDFPVELDACLHPMNGVFLIATNIK